MTMQRYPRNPIEQRKMAVRKYSRNGVIAVTSGLAGGTALWLLAGAEVFLVLGLIVAVVGGFVNYRRVQKIVNHRDEY
ncbi:hypothetical protein HW450_02450 [Corynebacterium hindlerae]|uniref:Uncharacterized protein n=1 Tax=Corynebacterium hindlerae TaxID=699041 RepID=A0A7G5FG87_9CORY|nr:hypothetical protein [Corynebacterium hindlerae]QMV85628.1 hypothetical protein HW450_02450 [Corynebacterium hindlerae]